MKSAKKRSTRSFFDLTPAERDREVARFDEPIDLDKETRPLTPKERLTWQRATGKSKPAARSSRRGKAAVTVELDSKLVRQSADYAAKHNMTLSEFVAKSLKGSLVVVG